MTIKRKDHDLSTTTHRNSADPNAYLTVPEYVDAIRELHRAAYQCPSAKLLSHLNHL